MSTVNENNINKEVIETAREAWNELTELLDNPLIAFNENEKDEFTEFYKALVSTLFEKETSE